MDYAIEVKSLRNDMGMNRMEFCEYFQIPYHTVVDLLKAGVRLLF